MKRIIKVPKVLASTDTSITNKEILTGLMLLTNYNRDTKQSITTIGILDYLYNLPISFRGSVTDLIPIVDSKGVVSVENIHNVEIKRHTPLIVTEAVNKHMDYLDVDLSVIEAIIGSRYRIDRQSYTIKAFLIMLDQLEYKTTDKGYIFKCGSLTELAEICDMAPITVSHIIAHLEATGLVRIE